MSKNKVAVVGTGYVGMSMAVLLAQHNEVVALDIDAARVDAINAGRAPIQDSEISFFLENRSLALTATLDPATAYKNADFIIVATPTDYDPESNFLTLPALKALSKTRWRIIRQPRLSSNPPCRSALRIDYVNGWLVTGLFFRRNSCAKAKR